MKEPDQKFFIAVFLVVAAAVFVSVFLYQHFLSGNTTDKSADNVSQPKDGDYVPFLSIDAPEGYGADFKTYTSKLGFSFQYPPYLMVMDVVDRDGKNRLYIVPTSTQANKNELITALVISPSPNNPPQTPEQWLLGPNSGYIESKDHYGNYYKALIDGQEAVYTDGGMWVVVNTPDNKQRLSIASLTAPGADILFSEMGILVESFSFNVQKP